LAGFAPAALHPRRQLETAGGTVGKITN